MGPSYVVLTTTDGMVERGLVGLSVVKNIKPCACAVAKWIESIGGTLSK
jgi:hypothetical protein